MKSYKSLKSELLKDKQVNKSYKALEPEYLIIQELIEKRLEKNISQSDLAKKIGTKQSAISRFESGSYNPSLEFLYKVADALNVKLRITVS